MNYPDPGDDEREALRMREESDKGSQWKVWMSLGLAIGCPLVIVIIARWWM